MRCNPSSPHELRRFTPDLRSFFIKGMIPKPDENQMPPNERPMQGILKLLTACLLLCAQAFAAEKPDVLFIIVDDLNDWVGCLGGHPQARTPNIDRLAARGTLFTKAYCVAPACVPSRTAVATGKRPMTTGVYLNEGFQNTPQVAVLRSSLTLSGMFSKNGYDAIGGGKTHALALDSNYKPANNPAIDKSTNKDALKTIAAGPLDVEDKEMGDYQVADWAIKQLETPRERPLFLAVGFVKPHLSFCVPRRWFDLHPLESVKLPEVIENDLSDVPAAGVAMAGVDHHRRIVAEGEWKRAVQAYLACGSFVDAQIGRVLDASDRRPSKRELIIVLWSDHGWNLGEKEHWQKFALWEDTTRVPMIYCVPGMTKPGSRCERPVDLLSLYPTLADLCRLPAPADLEGVSLLPLLKDPAAAWDRPAMTTWGRGNHALRSERYRYIRYADGGEELYDHQNDPNEWKNLASDPALAATKNHLARWLPNKEVPAPDAAQMKRNREAETQRGAQKKKAKAPGP